MADPVVIITEQETLVVAQQSEPVTVSEASPTVVFSAGQETLLVDDQHNSIVISDIVAVQYQARPPTDLTWTDYATLWTIPPSEVSPGIWHYLSDTWEVWRRVPAIYDAALDTFYSSFMGGVLSGELASRRGA